MLISFLYLILYFFVIVTSCGDEFDEKDDLALLGALKTEILLLISENNCSGIGECRALALGEKPCGGPWEYLIYSIVNNDTLKIKEKVEEYNDFNAVLNIRYNYESDCMFVEKPSILCLNGKCSERK